MIHSGHLYKCGDVTKSEKCAQIRQTLQRDKVISSVKLEIAFELI